MSLKECKFTRNLSHHLLATFNPGISLMNITKHVTWLFKTSYIYQNHDWSTTWTLYAALALYTMIYLIPTNISLLENNIVTESLRHSGGRNPRFTTLCMKKLLLTPYLVLQLYSQEETSATSTLSRPVGILYVSMR